MGNKLFFSLTSLLLSLFGYAQIDYKMSQKYEVGFLTVKEYNIPDQISTKDISKTMYSFSFEMGYSFKRSLNLYGKIKYGGNSNDSTYDLSIVNFSTGLKYLFRPYKVITPYVYVEANYAFNEWGHIDEQKNLAGEIDIYDEIYNFWSFGGLLGAGILFNFGKRYGVYIQANTFKNSFITGNYVEAGLNIKFLRRVK